MTNLVPPWNKDQRSKLLKAPFKFEHGLADTGLFDDEALVGLLDRWPHELYDINLFDFGEDGEMTLRTGVRGRTPGAKVIEGIKEGRMWIQLRGAYQEYPELKEALDSAFDEMRAQIPGFNPVNINAQLIMSAPNAKVAFHADSPGVMLFHMRGHKRLWVYPTDEAHMPQSGMEDIMLKQRTEDLPYKPAMDANATTLDLSPGEAASWQLHGPHRVENLGDFNVSLSVEFQTWDTRVMNGAHYTAGLMRRAGITPPQLHQAPKAARTALWAASLGLKRLPLVKDQIRDLDRTFELDGKPVTA